MLGLNFHMNAIKGALRAPILLNCAHNLIQKLVNFHWWRALTALRLQNYSLFHDGVSIGYYPVCIITVGHWSKSEPINSGATQNHSCHGRSGMLYGNHGQSRGITYGRGLSMAWHVTNRGYLSSGSLLNTHLTCISIGICQDIAITKGLYRALQVTEKICFVVVAS